MATVPALYFVAALLALAEGLSVPRRAVLLSPAAAALAPSASAAAAPKPLGARAPPRRCADIESCREAGDARVEASERANPTVRLDDGVRYKVTKSARRAGGAAADGAAADGAAAGGAAAGGDLVVTNGSLVDLAYSISQSSGAYMYSRGFGLEPSEDGDGAGGARGGGRDVGEYVRVRLGGSPRDVPLGIERALLGMRAGDARRVELPPAVGFATSEWRPRRATGARGRAAAAPRAARARRARARARAGAGGARAAGPRRPRPRRAPTR